MRRTPSAPIRVDLGFSEQLAGYLLAAHLSALFLVIILDQGIYLSCCLFTLIVLSLIYWWQRDLARSMDESVIGVDWSDTRGWMLRLKNGDSLRAVLCPSSIISRHLIILHFNADGIGRSALAIPGDATGKNQFRRLRVLLRMYNHLGE